jgi:hypothetical protein
VRRDHVRAADTAGLGFPPSPVRYRIVVRGVLSDTLLMAFPSLGAWALGGMTILEGRLDQSALFGVLAQIEALGLELLEVRRSER